MTNRPRTGSAGILPVITLLTFTLPAALSAQWASIGKVDSLSTIDRGLEFHASTAAVRVTFL